MSELRVGHSGGPGHWKGVIRDGKRVIWTCPHSHGNRDQSSMRERSARDCARFVLKLANNTDGAYVKGYRQWASLSNFGGASVFSELNHYESLASAFNEQRLAVQP